MDELTKDYKEYLYERLQDPAEAAEYLNATLEEDDPCVFLLALRYVVEARGVGKVATQAQLNRENLYRILSDQGNPRLSSMFALLPAIGIQLQVKPLKAKRSQARKGTIFQPSLFEQTKSIKDAQIAGSSVNEYQESDYEGDNNTNDESAAA